MIGRRGDGEGALTRPVSTRPTAGEPLMITDPCSCCCLALVDAFPVTVTGMIQEFLVPQAVIANVRQVIDRTA